MDTSGDQTEGASKGEPAQEALAQSDTHQRLESNYKELCKWVDTAKEVEYVGLFAGRESRAGRYASAIKVCACWSGRAASRGHPYFLSFGPGTVS